MSRKSCLQSDNEVNYSFTTVSHPPHNLSNLRNFCRGRACPVQFLIRHWQGICSLEFLFQNASPYVQSLEIFTVASKAAAEEYRKSAEIVCCVKTCRRRIRVSFQQSTLPTQQTSVFTAACTFVFVFYSVLFWMSPLRFSAHHKSPSCFGKQPELPKKFNIFSLLLLGSFQNRRRIPTKRIWLPACTIYDAFVSVCSPLRRVCNWASSSESKSSMNCSIRLRRLVFSAWTISRAR